MRSSRTVSRIVGLGMAIGMFGSTSSAWAQRGTLTRPIGDWLAAQGSCQTPPGFSTNYISWTGRRVQPDGPLDRVATMDYAGVDARLIADSGGPALPTRITGTVIERVISVDPPLTNVTVKVVARSALSYANEFDSSTGTTGDLFFGTTPQDVINGADPALGNCTLEAEYVAPRAPGGPMEDLFAGLFGLACPNPVPLDLRFVRFAGNADGECRDGSASLLNVTQTGLVAAAIHNGFQGALGDAFPAEWVELRPECN